MVEKLKVGVVQMADDDITRAIRALVTGYKVASARLFWTVDDIKVYEYRYFETKERYEEKYDFVYTGYMLVSKERNIRTEPTTEMPIVGSMIRFIKSFNVDFTKHDREYYDEQYKLCELDYFVHRDVKWEKRFYNDEFTSHCPYWLDYIKPLCPANNL